MMKRVVLDPGHVEGYNPGAIGGYAEGTAMYHYAHRLADKLAAQGVESKITRTTIKDNPGLMERGKTAQGYDMFVSLHSNGASAESAHGVSTFYSIKRDGDAALATRWCQELAKIINGGTRSRGASTRKGGGDWDYYTVIQGAVKVNCPRVFLIEHGFHTNKAECAWLMKEDNLDAMADVDCRMICEGLGVTYNIGADAPEPKPDLKPIGTFKVNAPGDTLNVRAYADYKATKLDELQDGLIVDAYDKAANGWVLVKINSVYGWVNGAYLVPAGSDKPTLDRLLKLTTPFLRGDDVRWTQQRLDELFIHPGVIDGIYGPDTADAVKHFQEKNFLKVDGIVGPNTWEKL